MAVVDNLEIQISVSAERADKAIKHLTKSIGTLATSLKFNTSSLEKLGTVNGNNFKKLGEGLQSFSNAAKSLQNVNSTNFTKLANGLEKIASIDSSKLEALGKIDGNSLKNVGEGAKALTTGLKELKDISKTDFNKLASGIERLGAVQPGNIQAVGNALRPLAEGINILSNAKFDNKNLQNLINSLTRLSNANTGSLANIDFTTLGNSIKDLTQILSGADKVQQNTISMTNAIAKLASAGANTGTTAAALPQLGEKLKEFMDTMSRAPTVNADTITFTQAIGTLANAGKKAEITANSLKKLGDELLEFFKTMSGAPNISQNTIQMTQALAQLANAGSRASSTFNVVGNTSGGAMSSLKKISNGIISAFRKVGNIFKTVGSGISSFTTRLKQNIPFINKTSKSTDTLIGKLGKLYIAYHSLRRIGQIFSEIITSASDYIEEFNYFNVSISKIAEESQGDYKKYGYASAKEYADSFRDRLTDLTKKMTGFKIGENGELSTNVNMKNLGLNITEITNFESRIAQMTNSVGMIGEASVVAAKGLTMLSGDLSSLANVPLQQVMNNLSSGLAGASMAVKKYGIDISVAALSEQAMSLGIEKSVSKMTQAEKEYLRVITMINQSKVAWGDLANTIDNSEELLLVA